MMLYECGICWTVYDPSLGDTAAQIPRETPFADLPAEWHCPNCAALKEKFLVREGDGAKTPRRTRSVEAVAAAVRAAYLAADQTMRGLPVHNPRLGFDTVGFREHAGAHTGIAVTPWCMVLLRVPFERPEVFVLGAKVMRSYPSGEYEFVAGEMEGVGAVETCSLFSPMDDFAEPEAARLAAEAAIEALFTPPQTEAPERAVPSRRTLLFGATS